MIASRIMNRRVKFFKLLFTCIAIFIASACTTSPNESTAKHSRAMGNVVPDVFTDPNQPIADLPDRLPPGRQEQFAKSNGRWLNIKSCGVFYIVREDGFYCPCYAKIKDVPANYSELDPTLYVWRDIRITREEIPVPDHDTMIALLGRPSADFTLREIDAPLQFVEVEKGKFVVGHLDFTFNVLYYFQGYLIPENALPPKGTQHRWPVVRSSPTETIWLVPIQVPAYLSD